MRVSDISFLFILGWRLSNRKYLYSAFTRHRMHGWYIRLLTRFYHTAKMENTVMVLFSCGLGMFFLIFKFCTYNKISVQFCKNHIDLICTFDKLLWLTNIIFRSISKRIHTRLSVQKRTQVGITHDCIICNDEVSNSSYFSKHIMYLILLCVNHHK